VLIFFYILKICKKKSFFIFINNKKMAYSKKHSRKNSRKHSKKTSHKRSPKHSRKHSKKTSHKRSRSFNRVRKSLSNSCSVLKRSYCKQDPNCHYVKKRGCFRRSGVAAGKKTYAGPQTADVMSHRERAFQMLQQRAARKHSR
jgi:hypothetical protein